MMLTSICPKLPMRNLTQTRQYYTGQLNFSVLGEYPDYLMLAKDDVEIHFFLFEELNPLENYGQVYVRLTDIHGFYRQLLNAGVAIHPNGNLAEKPWGQWEFSLLDPDHNLLTFGISVEPGPAV